MLQCLYVVWLSTLTQEQKCENFSFYCILIIRLHRRPVATYESASLRRFRFGRIDNIRSCTSETLGWCRAMVDQSNNYSVQIKFLCFHHIFKLLTIYDSGFHNVSREFLNAGIQETAKKWECCWIACGLLYLFVCFFFMLVNTDCVCFYVS